MTFKNFLTEGFIKLPEKMFAEGKQKIVEAVCSSLLSEIDSIEDADDLIKHVKTVASKHAATVKKIVSKPTRNLIKLKKVYSDLPAAYKKNVEGVKDANLTLVWKHSGVLKNINGSGAYRNTEHGTITIGIYAITEFNWTKAIKNVGQSDCIKMFDERLEKIFLTFEHELTHYVQYKILPNNDSKGSAGELNKNDAYYNSPKEFDPLIRTAIGQYRGYENDNLDIGMKLNRSSWIGAFVGTIPFKKGVVSDLPSKEVGYVTPSSFFLSLKKNDEQKWKKAIKLFTQELEKRYPK